MRAAPIRNPSLEDIYENVDRADEPVPSQRRITVRVSRPRQQEVRDLETLPPAKPLPRQMLAGEHEVPDQSMRRLRVAMPRVSGAPTSIEEPVTAAMLRDPRRD